MKTFRSALSVLLIVVMLLGTVAGCNKLEPTETSAIEPELTDYTEETEETEFEEEEPDELAIFPAGTTILGFDVSNLTASNAYLRVTNRLSDYKLSVTVNENTVEYSSEDFAVTLSIDSFAGVLEELKTNPDLISQIEPELLVYDEDSIIAACDEFPGITSTAKNAYIKYDKSAQKFVAVKEEEGYGIDTQPVIDAIKEAIEKGQTEVTLTIEPSPVTPKITQDCDKMVNALKRANALLSLNITYIFNPTTGSKHTDKLSVADIASLLYVKKDGITVAVDTDALDKFCSKKASQRGVFGQSVSFTTTDGQALNMNAIATGELVDTDDLYDDLKHRLTNGVSGTHTVAYYIVRPGDVSGNYDGNYVEVNLTQQHAWCYKNGKLIVSTDIVSGCVSEGHRTPTGVFKIRAKARNTYLIGPTWKSYVSYWMPFNGGIGLHDADRWRHGRYGGTIYLRNGSHGCVNMPLSAAQKMYNNVSKGTHVIVYGGSGSASSPQSISGTTTYNVNVGDAPFYVDARPRYTATMTFSSNNTSVVKVNSAGQVTIVGEGTAKITVKCGEDNCKLVITINVYPEGVAPPTETAPPTTDPAAMTTDAAATSGADISGATETTPASDTSSASESTAAPTNPPTDEPTAAPPTSAPTNPPTDPPTDPPAPQPDNNDSGEE